jgi:hypothetical protein
LGVIGDEETRNTRGELREDHRRRKDQEGVSQKEPLIPEKRRRAQGGSQKEKESGGDTESHPQKGFRRWGQGDTHR